MKYRQLGRSEITVSVVAMGCWSIVSDINWGRQDKADSIATIHAALDAGITFFDTAEGYGDGESEAILGETLASRRHNMVIASKANPSYTTPADLQRACENSLRRLKTDYIDLYQLHWPNRDIPLDEAMDVLGKLKQQGKIRTYGVCNFGPDDLSELLAVGQIETNQVPYSLLWRAIEYEVLPLCRENKIGILPYSPLAQGLLTGKFSSPDEVPEGRARTRHFSKDRPLARHSEAGCEKETFAAIKEIRFISRELGRPMAEVALAWLLHQPDVTAVLAGARQPEQIRQNAQAAILDLPAETLHKLSEVTEQVKHELGTNLDPWQSDPRTR